MALGRLSSGTAALVAGAVAAVIPPVLVLGLDQSIWLGLGAAGGAFGAILGVLGAWRARPESARLEPGAITGARAETARTLISDGRAALERLRLSARSIGDELMREEIKLLGMKADKVMREVQGDPGKVLAVRRLLTFYLPNAASVAEGWRALEHKQDPSSERVTQTRETMAALNDAFTQFADELHEPQMQTLDLDLKVLNDALKADLQR